MKIAFVWYWDRATEIYPNWRDGLRAAIEIIERDNDVQWFLDKNVPDPKDNWDFILFWDDSNSTFFNKLDDYSCRKGLCLTTAPQNFDNLRKLDVVYCESDPIYEAVRSQGIRAIKAFGTDSNFYIPDPWKETKKDIEYFYPATFSPWKMQDTIAYLGKDLTCVGTIQPDGQKQLDECQKNGVNIKVGYYPPEDIRDLYRRAKYVIIPAVHGSERTTLEAMSMNVEIKTTIHTNDKVLSIINEFLVAQLNDKSIKTSRDFILRNYSGEKYAEQLLKGIYV